MQVGCAYKLCDTLYDKNDKVTATGAHLLVCDYSPPGKHEPATALLSLSPVDVVWLTMNGAKFRFRQLVLKTKLILDGRQLRG